MIDLSISTDMVNLKLIIKGVVLGVHSRAFPL